MAGRFFLLTLLTLFVFFPTFSFGQSTSDPFNPDDSSFSKWRPKLVNDSLMPTPTYLQQSRNWIERSFGGKKTTKDPNEVAITVLRQDYNCLRFNESCMGNPLKIGTTDYSTGLGTHAQSEIQLDFPEPIVSFHAKAGIDNNATTGGQRGSVRFSVHVILSDSSTRKEVFRSPVKKGQDEASAVDLRFDPPVKSLLLVADQAGDGPNFDQCDWVETEAVGASGKKYRPNNYKVIRSTDQLPFSFKYNGRSSRELLKSWQFRSEKVDALNTIYSWTDPQTGLVVSAKVRQFEKFAGADWVLTFKNTSRQETPLLEEVLALDTTFSLGLEQEPLALHTLTGDSCNEQSWLPAIHSLQLGQAPLTVSPNGGRSSNGAFPFWNMARNPSNDNELNEGFFFACGWSGQWRARFAKSKQLEATAQIGMEKIATVLRPGEEIRSPRILCMPWRTDRLSAQALFRRLLMFEYAPKTADGAPQQIGLIGQCFDRYYRKKPGWEKYDGQVEFAKRLKAAGCTRYWFDAAWFPVGFPNGVGNWFSDKTNFPNGLEALGQKIEELGLSFVLWFEPERVAKNTQIANEYPQYVFGGREGGLYKLNDPEAREFLTKLLSKRISEYKVGVYRNDFNIDPLSYWRANDEKNRQGITEIRYVEGHYTMWNRLRAEHPGLWIDNCASGGRRIDLETIAISIPLWRSDTCCWPGHPEWDQNQTLGLAQYIPLFSSVAWDSSPYTFRSAANPGCIMQYNFLDDDYNPVESQKSVNEARAFQKFWYGDFYPLTKPTTDKTGFAVWQLHRPDLNAGLVYTFRQEDSPYLGVEASLRAIEPDAKYKINIKSGYESDKKIVLTGAEFKQFPIAVPARKSCFVIEYQKVQ